MKPAAFIVMADPWTAKLLRAELLERGWDAACTPSMGEAVLLAAGRGVSVVLVDQAALSRRDPRILAWAAGYERMRLVLLTGAVAEEARGPWRRILRRPLSLGAIAEALRGVASEPALPVASSAETEFTARLGAPWPMIACAACGASRHYEVPLEENEERAVEADLPAFVVEHACCKADVLL